MIKTFILQVSTMHVQLRDLPEGRNWTVDELNDREVQLLIPVIMLMSVVIVVGTLGNALVLYINIVVIKLRNSIHIHFITFLAFVDITFCTISCSLFVLDLSHQYTFTNTLACKSLRAFASINAISSVMTIFLIAVDRYRRICRPHGNQFSLRSIKLMFGIILFLSCIFSIPVFIIHGKSTVQTRIANITGMSCSTDEMYKDSLFAKGYMSLFGAVFIILAVLMSVLYLLVWRQIWKHTEPTKTSALPDTTESQTEPTTSEVTLSATDPGKYLNNEHKNKRSTDRAKVIRVSKILFVVTAIFVLSFAPYYFMKLLKYFHKELIANLDTTSTVFYHLFLKSYSINFMVNPFIYGVMDTTFRKECKKLVLKICPF